MNGEEQADAVNHATNAQNEIRHGSRDGHNLSEVTADGRERKCEARAALMAARGGRAYERATSGTEPRASLLLLRLKHRREAATQPVNFQAPTKRKWQWFPRGASPRSYDTGNFWKHTRRTIRTMQIIARGRKQEIRRVRSEW